MEDGRGKMADGSFFPLTFDLKPKLIWKMEEVRWQMDLFSL
jgi:hypothetical protein